jgi:hypothetical protein
MTVVDVLSPRRRYAVLISAAIGVLAASARGAPTPTTRLRVSTDTELRQVAEEILARLNWALDEGNFAQASELFALDGSFQLGDNELKGRTAIANGLATNAARYAGCASAAANLAVDAVDDRSLRVRSYRLVYAGAPAETLFQSPELVALYRVDDLLERGAAGWLVRRRLVRSVSEATFPW